MKFKRSGCHATLLSAVFQAKKEIETGENIVFVQGFIHKIPSFSACAEADLLRMVYAETAGFLLTLKLSIFDSARATYSQNVRSVVDLARCIKCFY